MMLLCHDQPALKPSWQHHHRLDEAPGLAGMGREGLVHLLQREAVRGRPSPQEGGKHDRHLAVWRARPSLDREADLPGYAFEIFAAEHRLVDELVGRRLVAEDA